MTAQYAKHVSTKITPQSEPIPGSNQVANNAGGYCYPVDDFTRLDRFLILGSEGGTYYATERKLTQENAQIVLQCAKQDPTRTIDRIVEISKAGRAPKNDPAIFALSLLVSQVQDTKLVQLAGKAVPHVCRIGTHLFQFVAACNEMRGWGHTLHNAILSWHDSMPDSKLAYQAVKYQERERWTHADLLRKCRPIADKLRAPRTVVRIENTVRGLRHHYGHTEDTRSILYRWMLKGWDSVGEEPHPDPALKIVWAFEKAKRTQDKAELLRLILDYRLPRECVPTQWLNDPDVWGTLLVDMPVTAMIRSLGKMTAVGVLTPLSSGSRRVCSALGNVDVLKRARVHPISLLLALKIYQQGHGEKGKLSWSPDQTVVAALEEAFYLAFDAVEPTNQNWLIGIDVSGSMGATICGSPLTCCEAGSALAMVTAKTEPFTFIGRFNCGFQQVPFTRTSRLPDVLQYTRSINCGGTDCSMPMVHAYEQKIPVDNFLVITDSETWAGTLHPSQALKNYRQKMGRNAKLTVLAMTSSGFTIADPNDGGMMDIVGYDTAVPTLLTDFAKGGLIK